MQRLKYFQSNVKFDIAISVLTYFCIWPAITKIEKLVTCVHVMVKNILLIKILTCCFNRALSNSINFVFSNICILYELWSVKKDICLSNVFFISLNLYQNFWSRDRSVVFLYTYFIRGLGKLPYRKRTIFVDAENEWVFGLERMEVVCLGDISFVMSSALVICSIK